MIIAISLVTYVIIGMGAALAVCSRSGRRSVSTGTLATIVIAAAIIVNLIIAAGVSWLMAAAFGLLFWPSFVAGGLLGAMIHVITHPQRRAPNARGRLT
jgi:hypothetical protein